MRVWLALMVLLVPGAAMAEPVLKPGFADCVAANGAAGAPVSACIEDAQFACTAYSVGEAAGHQCYVTAKDEWGALIRSLIDGFGDQTAQFQAIARIEAKYAVTRNLMNCARQYELSIIGRESNANDSYDLARCEAVAMGVAYVELLYASGEVTRP